MEPKIRVEAERDSLNINGYSAPDELTVNIKAWVEKNYAYTKVTTENIYQINANIQSKIDHLLYTRYIVQGPNNKWVLVDGWEEELENQDKRAAELMHHPAYR